MPRGKGRMKSAGKRVLHDTTAKINPLDKKIDQNDTADHGVESMRLAYRAGKQGTRTIKTVDRTVKTTAKTIKAAKKAPRTIIHTVKRTARMAVAATRFTANVLVHMAAALINPITWIVLFFSVVIYVILSIVVILMGGASTQSATQAISYTQQVGIDDADLEDARNFYRIACERNKNNFAALINSLYYDSSDLRHSDLVYMIHSVAGNTTQYTKGYPTDGWKQTLISAWTISVPEAEAIAIAYVYLEMQENDANGTEQQIYEIEYTQEIFNKIVDTSIRWSDTTYPDQPCANKNCTVHYDERPNPEYQTARSNYLDCVHRRDDFVDNVVPNANNYSNMLEYYRTAPPQAQSAMQKALENARAELIQAFRSWEDEYGYTGWAIDEDLGQDGQAWLDYLVDEARDKFYNTPETIKTPYRACDRLHALHSIGFFTYDKNIVMTALGFTDADKQWEELIEMGMELDLNRGA